MSWSLAKESTCACRRTFPSCTIRCIAARAPSIYRPFIIHLSSIYRPFIIHRFFFLLLHLPHPLHRCARSVYLFMWERRPIIHMGEASIYSYARGVRLFTWERQGSVHLFTSATAPSRRAPSDIFQTLKIILTATLWGGGCQGKSEV